MKKFLLVLAAIVCLPFALQAQQDKQDDSRYLAGAVPEVEGKVVFTREFSIPGMSKDEIYDRLLKWMENTLKENGNNSRVVFCDKENGTIVGTGDEWIVFSSSALSLDRTRILYQVTAECQPERCTLQVSKIRYIYREGKEKYTAEEWIVDKYALNKTQTKLVRGLAKWRRKTVDFVDNMASEVADVLSSVAPQPQVAAAEEKKEQNPTQQQGPIVVTPRTTVVQVPETQPRPLAVTKPEKTDTTQPQPGTTQQQPDIAQSQPGTLKEIAPDQLSSDLIKIGSGRLVIVIGNDAFNMTTMTANAGGSLGKMQQKPVIFTMLSPDQPHEAMDKATTYVVRFYPAGQEEPTVILQCRQMPAQEPIEGQPRMYIGEILKAMVRE